MEFDAQGRKIETGNAGAVQVITKNGTVYTVEKDGKTTIDLQSLNGVGIENLVDVLEYRITSIVGIHSHFVRFVDNGLLEFAYNTNGHLVSLSMQSVKINITDDNVITVGRFINLSNINGQSSL